MGMVGVRSDVLFVAPASSFHHSNHDPFISDHHHHHQSINNSGNNNSSATALGIGVIPLLTATPCGGGGGGGGGGGSSHLWQNQHTQTINYPNKKPFLITHENSQNQINNGGGFSTGISSGGVGGGGISSSTRTCHDCGNQAKKDCTHSRCRTCCKSRGYDCSTHVKSTWVSAARRRDRFPGTMGADQGDGGVVGGVVGGGGGASSGSTSAVKKPRLVTSQTNTTASHTSTSTPPRSFDTSSSHHQDLSFRETLPKQVRAPASFKCVRVTPIGDGEDEIAYQAIVKIGGHVFKGFLYNKGLNGIEGLPNIAELHLNGGCSTSGGGGGGGGGGRNWASSSSPIIDPSDVYAASGGGFLGSGGTSFGNIINL